MKFKLLENKIDINDVKTYHEHTDSYKGQHNYIIFAEYKGRPIGYAQIMLFDGDLIVADIQVNEAFRRMGVGSKIMKHAKTDPEFEGYTYKPSWKTDLGMKFKHKDV